MNDVDLSALSSYEVHLMAEEVGAKNRSLQREAYGHIFVTVIAVFLHFGLRAFIGFTALTTQTEFTLLATMVVVIIGGTLVAYISFCEIPALHRVYDLLVHELRTRGVHAA